MDPLVNQLKSLLADLSIFRIKTQYFHWNIEGPNFIQYHKFLGEIYEQAATDVDDVAEHIRALGPYAPGSMKRFLELGTLSEEITIPTAGEMLIRVYKDNQVLLESLKAACETASESNQLGVLNFLEGLVDAYEKQGWMLRVLTKP